MASLSVRLVGRAVRCSRLALMQSRRGYADAPAAVTQMQFTFGSPTESFYQDSTAVKQVDVPTGSGVIGILANHVPTLGVLKPGVLTVFEMEGKVNKYFVSSGTFSVNEDSSVQIVAEESVAIDQLDRDRAKENLTKAQSSLASATTDIERAEAQVLIECNEAIVNAA